MVHAIIEGLGQAALKRHSELHYTLVLILFYLNCSFLLLSKETSGCIYGEETHQKLGQHEELYFEQYIDWSIVSYGDDLPSKEEAPTELVAKWIIGRKRKHSPKKQPDQ